MGSTQFRNPRALSSTLASLGTLQPRAFGFLNRIDPLVSASNLYIVVTLHDFTSNIGMAVDLSTVMYNKYYNYLQLHRDGARMHVIAGGVHFGFMPVPATAYTLSRSRVKVQTGECFRTCGTS